MNQYNFTNDGFTVGNPSKLLVGHGLGNGLGQKRIHTQKVVSVPKVVPKVMPKEQQEPRMPYMYPTDDEIINPYEVFNLPNNSPFEEVQKVYKKLIIVLHPDKQLSDQAKKLGWTLEEKNKAYQQVQKAYKQIATTSKEINFPDYDIKYKDYNDREDLKPVINTADFYTNDRFENSKFNANFEKIQKQVAADGFIDPYMQGYSQFGRTNDKEAQMIFSSGTRADIAVEEPKEFHQHHYDSDNQLVSFTAFEMPYASQAYSELGLTKINDYSIKCSDGLCGTDLMQVYDKNKEYWEDTFKRDQHNYAKFTDQKDLSKAMNASVLDRKQTIEPKLTDHRLISALAQSKQNEIKQDLNRSKTLQKADHYWSNLRLT